MGNRLRCCGGNCYLLTDDFDDPESTTLSSDWNEVSGDWSYDGSGLLVEAGTAESAVLTVASSTNGEQAVVAQAPTFSVGDKFRVIANAVDDDNYLFMEVEVGSGVYYVRLCSRIGGSESVLSEDEFGDSLDSGQPLGMDICLSRNIFVGTITNEGVTAAEGNRCYTCSHTLISGGKHAGLGNGGTSEITWDGFVFGDLVTSDPEQTGAAGQCRTNQCCIMPCTCCEGTMEVCIPKTLLMVISAGGGCLPIDDAEVFLYYNPGTGNWESEIGALPCFSGRFIFTCNWNECLTEDAQTFGLYLYSGGCTSDYCLQPVDGWWDTSYTCDPFEVHFPGTGYDGGYGGPCECCDDMTSGTWGPTIYGVA